VGAEWQSCRASKTVARCRFFDGSSLFPVYNAPPRAVQETDATDVSQCNQAMVLPAFARAAVKIASINTLDHIVFETCPSIQKGT
jgi:hypothetical protein